MSAADRAEISNWIVGNQAAYKTSIVLATGDNVGDATLDASWVVSKGGYDILDAAGIPLLIGIGNHDYNTGETRGAATKLNTYFPQSRFPSAVYAESGQSQNSYLVIGDYLFFMLEFGPRQAILDWVIAVITANPTKKIIFSTHGMEYDAGGRFATIGDLHDPHDYYASDTHDGQEIWDEALKAYDNVMMCIGGHYSALGGMGHHTATGDLGNQVESLVYNTQGDDQNIRLYTFYAGGNFVWVRTYNPGTDTWSTQGDRQFWINY